MKNKLGMAVGGMLCLAAAGFGQENYAQWHAYRTITLNGTNGITGATVKNFPVLVRLSSSNFDFSKASAAGSDVRFAKTNGTTHLPYQIERWDTASHTAAVWVLVDTITSAATGATIRMYYGKSGSADSSRGDLVFSTTNNYQGVFHLGEAAGDTARDATGNKLKGIPKNKGGSPPADLAAGLIGKAKNFLGSNANNNGGSYDIVQANGSHTYTNNPLNFQNDSSTVNGLPQYTISAWIYPDAFPDGTTNRKGIISKSAGINGRQFHLRAIDPVPDQINPANDTNRVEFNDGVGAVYKSSAHHLLTGNWYHVVAVRSGVVGDSTHMMIYVDGGNIFHGSTNLTQTTRSDYDVYIGSFSNDSGYFSGKIDEVEFSNVARDSNWVKLSYQTQKPGASVVTVGDSIITPASVVFTYRTNPLVLTKGVAMVADTPKVTAGTATSWSVTPALPAGLTLSTSTGVISGTPTTAQSSANYTVTATGPGGTGKATITITVNGPPIIAYSPSSVTDTTTKAAKHTPTSTGGAITSCVAKHALPAGLSLSSSCVISGTPTTASTANLDTITATGPGGTGKATITITVIGPPIIAYSPSSVTDTTTKAAKHTPTSTGGAITSCVAKHALPAGLSLSSSCVISGTPTTASAANLDTITATGPGGTGKATITITVIGPPIIAYSPSSVTDTTTKAAKHTPTSTGGAITSCVAKHALPAGLSLSSSCVISGTPTTASAANLDTITATGPGGTGKATITITVIGPPIIAYSPSSVTDTTTKAAKHTPTSTGGAITSCVAKHALPAGLSLSSSCVISGTPTTASAANLDTITATGPGGTGKASITITVISLLHLTGILGPFVVKVPGLSPFSYRVPEGSLSVLMTVEDIQGRVVWNKEMATDKSRVVSWMGKESNGRRVSSGMYVVKLKLLDIQHSSLGELRQTGGITR